jgi:4-amino-4-deoxy-L-arabinose transferase-like glycosyltransferase
LLTLSLVALWGIPALVATQGEFFQVGIGKHVVARSVGVLEGHGLKGLRGYLGSLPFYPLTLLVGFLPWSPWLVRSLWKRRSSGPLSPIDRYLATSVLGVFVVFTLIRTKLPHYTLPAFPLIALWLGKTIAGGPENARWIRRLTVGTTAILMIVAVPGIRFFARVLPVPRLAQECRRWIGPDTQLATFEFHEPSLFWYLRPDGGPWIQHLNDESAVLEFLAQPGNRVCVLPTGEVFRHAAQRYPKLVTVSTEGFNPANGKHVELRALIKPAAP